MKFKKGDVVRFKPEHLDTIVEEFKSVYGTGPFLVKNGYRPGHNFYLTTIDGRDLIREYNKMQWHHTPDLLMHDTFLDAARKAVNGHQKKSPLQRKSKAS